jgi:hypothetical protein
MEEASLPCRSQTLEIWARGGFLTLPVAPDGSTLTCSTTVHACRPLPLSGNMHLTQCLGKLPSYSERPKRLAFGSTRESHG